MCIELKTTVKRQLSSVSDYSYHADIFDDEDDEDIQPPQRFPVSATIPNLIVDDKYLYTAEYRDGWNLDEKGPKNIVKGFSNLKIKLGYNLIGYRYIGTHKGYGVVWGIPNNIELHELDEFKRLDDSSLSSYKPTEVLDDYMLCIEGDKSPFSYLQAAILKHELGEYGASGYAVNWRRDSILPWSKEKLNNINEESYQWDMLEEEPEIIEPHFYFNYNNEPVVVFYTINDIHTITFNEYKHIFNKENYTLKVERKLLGTAGCGIIF